METIQYSLKKNSTYSIDLKSSIRTLPSNDVIVKGTLQMENHNNTSTKNIQIYKHSNKTNKITKTKTTNDIFDKHCIETYGEKTCILFELDNDNIEMRLLDNIYQLKYTNRNKLYTIIPSLLEHLYTVVLVQIIQKTNTKTSKIIITARK